MATASSVATSVDVLSVAERKLVVDALVLKSSSVSRAARAATITAVVEAYNAERVAIDALIVKFR